METNIKVTQKADLEFSNSPVGYLHMIEWMQKNESMEPWLFNVSCDGKRINMTMKQKEGHVEAESETFCCEICGEQGTKPETVRNVDDIVACYVCKKSKDDESEG